MKDTIYTQCPVYETESFMLRLVKEEDAQPLLACYSDREVVEKANADHCTSDFYYSSLEEMRECIGFWLDAYASGGFVRFSIVLKRNQNVIGTVEVFGGEIGVLRIDIATKYDNQKHIDELLRLAVFSLIPDFGIQSLKVKAQNTPDRIDLLTKYGFTPSETFRAGLGYYERSIADFCNKEKGLAYCGLACCVCSENAVCAGCRNDGCRGKEWCKSFTCCREKGLSGCWECEEFPCDNPMLSKPRVRTFARFVLKHGEEKLLEALERNEKRGINYHYPGLLIGDYDLLAEEEIMELLL